MLNFRNTNILFAVLLAILVYLDVQLDIGWYWYFILVISYTLFLFYGSFYIGSNFYVPVVCNAPTDKKQIAISFDDGPLEKHTPQVLATLKEYNVAATFFCIGYRVAEHEQLFRQIVKDGHLVGSHSYYHDFWFDMHSAKKMQAEMQQMEALVHRLTGKKMNWFRPPYGVTNPNVSKAVKAMKYTAIGWNARSLDTMIKEENKLLQRLQQSMKPGAIFLLHDTSHATANILPQFLQYVKEQGYEIVPLDKLLNLPPYA